ncbi:MAG: 50S ribosomal protein L24 [Prolixibacteraceae bacterium]|jgi:large subunit ribosomal protein L24|nr:50S ribosomal protein L24 [Prolixibacteraceae bacterium]MDI9563037.1 50S ribosomal protein L24 [Bacteroidota bacterium]NLS98844.1 50S ribosomal protein L24 [Bacteroidales bacterium]OQB80633.1 MAG: 50S ribosomal protein L24 [Bacteroidetes bacterium ADurb.Bin123]HNZ68120.1 50S ribosomal protein L24 [Prolixibacteraceae bacterium]
MQKKLHIRKGDMVVVISGDYSGSKGRVLQIDRKTERAIVEGVNIIKKHTKPNTEYPQGGIIEKEAPVHISNLMLVDPKTGKPTRIGRKLNDDGKLVRYSKKSGEEIK